VSHKSASIAELVQSFQGRELDAHYLGYFALFNQQKFFEAHEVLEELWLPARRTAEGDFYKGLIQLTGAFVHLQKKRLRPAAALFKLAQSNLAKYPSPHARLNLTAVGLLIDGWQWRLTKDDYLVNPLAAGQPPQLALQT